MRKFFDDFGNMATIETEKIFPYRGASKKITSYILKCFAMYDGGRLYYCACYQNKDSAIRKLKEMSCGTFKEKILIKE